MLFVTDYVTGLTRDSISAPAERMLCALNDVLLQLINAFLYLYRQERYLSTPIRSCSFRHLQDVAA